MVLVVVEVRLDIGANRTVAILVGQQPATMLQVHQRRSVELAVALNA
jgi:hypothetical protein